MMMITIFTPTYNRGYLLNRLYKSLVAQTYQNFEWVIVDDGSLDNTEEVIEQFIDEKKIIIRYYKQENQGKHIAINHGLQNANGELFFIVDSDDLLTNNALSIVIKKYNIIKDNYEIAGIVGRRGYISGGYIGSDIEYNDVIASALEFRYRHKINGDMAEVFRTEVMKKYPFPKIKGEKFCPESMVWNDIAQKYRMLWFSDIIYKGEYIEDGLTSNVSKIRKKAHKTMCLYYSKLAKYDIPFLQKIKAIANYWRFAIYDDVSFVEKMRKVNLGISFLALPVAILLILKDNK